MSQSLTPVYTIKRIVSYSKPETWESIAATAKLLVGGYIVLWQHHAIFTGVVKGGEVIWLGDEPVAGDKHLVRLRAFDETKEYHFWSSGGKFQGRLRSDGSGKIQEAVDSSMMLRSVVGIPLQLASPDLAVKDWAVVTRNYIDCDEATQQAGYVDSRFLKFQSFNASIS